MNERQIKNKLCNFYKDFISNVDNEDIRKDIINHSFVTGGAITSMLLNEEINDYDIYIDDIDICKKIIQYFLKSISKKLDKDYFFHDYIDMENKIGKIENRVKIYIPDVGNFINKENDKLYNPIFVSSNAITLNNNVQIIIRFVGNPKKIHKNYDFEHTKCYYQPKNNKLVLPKKAIKSILMKELIYTGSKYPLASIIRTRKFIKRGWNINAGQYLKMALQLQKLDLSDPKVLSDQLTGVDLYYFNQIIRNIEERKNEKLDITLDWLMETIDNIFDNEEKNITWDKYFTE